MDGKKLEWMRRKVQVALGVTDELFTDMMDGEGSDQPESGLGGPAGAKYTLTKFFGAAAPVAATVFFFLADVTYQEPAPVEKSEVQAPASEAQPAEAAAGGQEGDAPADDAPEVQMITRTRRACLVSEEYPGDSVNNNAFYFVRNIAGEIPTSQLQASLEFGMLAGHVFRTRKTGNGPLPLSNMHRMLQEMYLPWFDTKPGKDSAKPKPAASAASATASASSGGSSGGEDGGSASGHLHNEFKGNLQRIVAQVEQTIIQVQVENQLDIPAIDLADKPPRQYVEDFTVMQQLEFALESWTGAIQTVVEEELSKVPRNRGPLAEIEFWRQRAAALSVPYEQINMATVQAMLEILSIAEVPLMLSFKHHYAELAKLNVEAKDNVKFLTTLERHFKNITTGTFGQLIDTLPLMMNSIRMVNGAALWRLSDGSLAALWRLSDGSLTAL
jgi:dynein heavy chain